MRPLLFFVGLLLASGLAVAQEPDTLDPRGYFPLAVGNEWEYRYDLYRPASPYRERDESRTEYYRVRIIDGGLGPDGDQFAIVEERLSGSTVPYSRDTVLVWYDQETASVLMQETYDNGVVLVSPFFGAADTRSLRSTVEILATVVSTFRSRLGRDRLPVRRRSSDDNSPRPARKSSASP